ncbi:MAG TPA: helix-turn-helix transcriptional regulator, partial [Clostridia bacterium]|nr:helix-turn-helix transcriptional regulator [Clostridia bacterium]
SRNPGRDNIKEKITLENISLHADISKYYLSNVFKLATNQNVMEYVRGRKLAKSLHELYYTNMKIIDISYEYNFSCEQCYIRSFKERFKISPNRARKKKIPLSATEKLEITSINGIKEKKKSLIRGVVK